MAGYTFKGKQKICYTKIEDFTDYQGIGRDPLYMRYDSVFSIVRKMVAPEFQHFLATPLSDGDIIYWYIHEWEESPKRLVELIGQERDKYESIKNATIQAYRSAIEYCNGEELKILSESIRYIDNEQLYCCDDKVYLVAWGMTPDQTRHRVNGGVVIHDIEYTKKFKISFHAGKHGQLVSKLDKSALRREGEMLSQRDIPEVTADEGWEFDGWSPSPLGIEVNSDLTFTATYKEKEKEISPVGSPISAPDPTSSSDSEKEEEKKPEAESEPTIYTCYFNVGEHGRTDGTQYVHKPENSMLTGADIPRIKADQGYTFTGWNISPYNLLIDCDRTFVAQYDRDPWYLRLWTWLTQLFSGRGCLMWILWLLLLLLAIWLLSFIFHSCEDHGHRSTNGVIPVDSITTVNGRVIENNGYIRPITGHDGKLPDAGDVVAPVLEEGGAELPIIRQPGAPNTIANRLFLFLENENDDIDALAQDFKKAYPEEKYAIIGYDKEVKLLVIQVPENERDQIRKTINERISNHQFIVFDEEIYEINGHVNSNSESPGWHLEAIHLKQGWNVTKGSPKVKVAIVDDGIDALHPMFDGRIEDAYNVFTKDNRLSVGKGHGTHTAGLAVGAADYYDKGAAGVAPLCKLMPIQVFSNQQCPLSALVAGTMFAIHHGADVVNISIAPSFSELSMLPIAEQNEIAGKQFKNVEKLWTRVCNIAAKKNCILVFAAGNDNILAAIPPENRNASSIVVAAVDKHRYPTDFTNYGSGADISAPGKDIYSSFPGGKFQSFDGTSMAAPIVSGTIALMKSIKKDLTVEQSANVLYKTGSDVYGNIPPMVLVDKALEGVKRGDFSAPTERRMPPIPEGEGDESAAKQPMPITDKDPNSDNVPPQQETDDTDYAAIRRKIAEYKEKINQLEKLLPDNK